MPPIATKRVAKGGRLGRKQQMAQADWLYAREHVEESISRGEIMYKVQVAAGEIQRVCRAQGWRRVAYCWSGGKDSIALEYMCAAAGLTDCVLGLGGELEYPAFLQWVTDHMPHGLEVVDSGLTYEWLRAHPELLFPQDSATAAEWFHRIQHTAQARYYKQRRLDALVLGRRKADGNYVGPKGQTWYTNAQGVTRFSPIADWTHEDVFALLHYQQLPIPPIYAWPNGYRVGTGVWPARQWTGSQEQGWNEVWSIDRTRVEEAARFDIPGARAALARLGS